MTVLLRAPNCEAAAWPGLASVRSSTTRLRDIALDQDRLEEAERRGPSADQAQTHECERPARGGPEHLTGLRPLHGLPRPRLGRLRADWPARRPRASPRERHGCRMATVEEGLS